MTIFGKLVLGLFMLIIGGSVFYGVTNYVKKDSEPIAAVPVVTEMTSTSAEVMSASTTEDGASLSATTTDSKASGKKMAFTEFMSKGGAYKCDVTQIVATMTTKGTVYMHDALVRAEFSNSVAGQSLNTTMIARDGYMYSWTSLTPNKGYKTKLAADTTPKPGQPATYTWNGSQVGDYDCQAWKADDSLFDLPKTVTFAEQQ